MSLEPLAWDGSTAGTRLLLIPLGAAKSGQIEEGSRYKFRLEGTGPSPGLHPAELFEVDPDDGCTGRFLPKNHVGTVRVTCGPPSEPVTTFDVEVRPAKLDYTTEYRAMMEHIADVAAEAVLQGFAPSSAQVAPDPACAGALTYRSVAFLAARLRSSELQSALEQIVRSPHRRWVSVTERRALNHGLPRSGANARQLTRSGPRVPRPPHLAHLPMTDLPRTLDHHETVVSYDTPPNRFVRFALQKWQGVALDLHRSLESSQVGAGPLARGLDETKWLADRCEDLLTRSPLDEVSDMRLFPHGDPVLLRQAGYREVLRTYSLAEASVALEAVLPDDPFSATQRNVATLYEYWCFVAMMRCLSDLCGADPSGELFDVNQNGLSLVLRQGDASKLSWGVEIFGRRLALDLWFNRDFRRAGTRAEHSSWAAAMRPDISLRIRPRSARPDGGVDPDLDVWLHFDAKYRVDGVVNSDAVISDDPPDVVAKRADVLKMHAYRDAIRRSAGAYVLYPGAGAPQHRQEHHEILPGIGAFPLRPAERRQINGLRAVTNFLREVLDHTANQASAAERSQFWLAVHSRNSGRRIAPSTGLLLPPADEKVLVGYVRADQVEWVRRTRQYNVRADQRPGAVHITDDMITARLVVLWIRGDDGQGELFGVFERTGPWQVALADDLQAQGYPTRETAARYLVTPINVISPTGEPVLASRVRSFEVEAQSAPHATTWAELMDSSAGSTNSRAAAVALTD